MTSAIDKVAESYRTAQAATAARTALGVSRFWKGVEVGNEESERNFVALATPLVMNGWTEQVQRAAEFIEQRTGELAERLPPNEQQIQASMGYVGPILARRAMRAGTWFEEGFIIDDPARMREMYEAQMRAPGEAREHVAKQVRGAAVRLSSVGAREMSHSIVKSSGTKIGYARVTGPDPCAFCVMLASRGPDFGEDSFEWSNARFEGPGNAKVHDSCVVGSTTVTGPAVEAGTRRWYEGPLVIIRTSSGHELSITPNHPVLTDHGWIPAGLLREGDQVVSNPAVDGALGRVPYERQHPSAIEDVLGSLLMVGTSLLVPGSTEQFHGDGTKAEVNVVAANGFLAGRGKSAFDEPFVDLSLSGAGASSPSTLLSSLCPEHHLALTGDAPDVRLMGGGGQGLPPFGSGLLEAQLLGGGLSSHRHPGLLEAPLDGPARHSVLLGEREDALAEAVLLDNLVGRQGHGATPRFDPASLEFVEEGAGGYARLGLDLLDRLAGEVQLDSVVEARRVDYSGHVFNLQTSEGWYSADGVIVSNCKCSLIVLTTADLEQLTQWRAHERTWLDLSSKDVKATDSSPIVTFRRNYERALRAA